MTPIRFGSSSSTMVTSESATLHEDNYARLSAPAPASLNLVTSRLRPPSSQLKLEERITRHYMNPARVPGLTDSLKDRKTAISGSTSSATRFPTARYGRPESSSSVLLALAVSAKALQSIHNHSLLKGTQQRRDEELARSLPDFSGELVEITRSYAMEVMLLPLQFDHYGCALRNVTNNPILARINETLLADDPDKELFQMEVVKNHGDLLDSVFAEDLGTPDRLNLLNRVANNQPAALQLAQKKFRALAGYLTYANCQSILNTELAKMKRHPGDYNNVARNSAINIRLLVAEMQKIDLASEKHRRIHALECTKAELLLAQAKSHIRKNRVDQGCESLLDALEGFCRLGERRRVIEILIFIIKLDGKGCSPAAAEMLGFYNLARDLCLMYPANYRLYAELLFATDRICQKRSDFTLLQKLYRQAMKDNIQLPDNYRAKLLYMQNHADYRAGEAIPALTQRVSSALASLRSIYRLEPVQFQRPVEKFTDLANSQFFHSVSGLYQLKACIALDQLSLFKEMSPQQQKECANLFSADLSREGILSDDDCRAASLWRTSPVLKTPGQWMLHSIADNYKSALKSFLPEFFPPFDILHYENEKTFVAVFDTLVDFYRKCNGVHSLQLLLADKNITDFVRLSSFKKALPIWRESLTTLQEAQKKVKSPA